MSTEDEYEVIIAEKAKQTGIPLDFLERELLNTSRFGLTQLALD